MDSKSGFFFRKSRSDNPASTACCSIITEVFPKSFTNLIRSASESFSWFFTDGIARDARDAALIISVGLGLGSFCVASMASRATLGFIAKIAISAPSNSRFLN